MNEETLSKANSLSKQKNMLLALINTLDGEYYRIFTAFDNHAFGKMFSDEENISINRYLKKQANKKLKAVQVELESL